MKSTRATSSGTDEDRGEAVESVAGVLVIATKLMWLLLELSVQKLSIPPL